LLFRGRFARYAVIAACGFSACFLVKGQSAGSGELSSTTEYRVASRDWWPTKGSLPLDAFAGASACQKCHSDEAATQATTPMFHAAFHSAVGINGAKVASGSVRKGPYLYRISSENSKLTVSAGTQSITANIDWTFGTGVHGQTYVLENQGTLYDSQVSSFVGIHGMDITPGHLPAKPGDLQKALGMGLAEDVATRCFGCHTTFSTTKDQFTPKQALPGVMCEACHGPSLAHALMAKSGMIEESKSLVLNPRSLSPVESVDFCGACHRTTLDVTEAKFLSPNNVRFQPYRLEKSRCWGVRGDERLVCIACHNPHEPLVHDASAYDKRCLSCHNQKASDPADPAKPAHEVCPKATANCTTCHMPKSYVGEMHAKFTDHYIRIVRPGDKYPN
jgi:Cytochrome c554 and c-prime